MDEHGLWLYIMDELAYQKCWLWKIDVLCPGASFDPSKRQLKFRQATASLWWSLRCQGHQEFREGARQWAHRYILVNPSKILNPAIFRNLREAWQEAAWLYIYI